MNIAVLPFQISANIKSINVDIVQESLIMAISKNSQFRALEREQIHQIIKEQKLSLSELFDDQSAISVGKLASAKYVVSGKIIGDNSQAILSFRVVGVETGEIMISRMIELDGKLSSLKLADQLSKEVMKPAVKASSEADSHDASKAVDGDNSTYWSAKQGNYSASLEIRFLGENSFTKWTLSIPEEDYCHSGGLPKNFSIQYHDGTKWIVVADVNSNFKAQSSGSFEAATSSLWKIDIRDTVAYRAPVIGEFALEQQSGVGK